MNVCHARMPLCVQLIQFHARAFHVAKCFVGRGGGGRGWEIRLTLGVQTPFGFIATNKQGGWDVSEFFRLNLAYLFRVTRPTITQIILP